MKHCVVIPCFDHAATVAGVARAARAHAPVIIVDDGSAVPLPEIEGCILLRLDRNHGKGAALRAGLERAAADGFTHAITMDADGQHSADDLPKFVKAARSQPEALVVGVRDFIAAGAPAGRRRSNAVSTFWFRVETGVRLGDTQCGFRCYPVEPARRLVTRSGRYAFELEFMVRWAWTDAPIVPVTVACSYRPEQLRQSHFRPVLDLAHITLMNIGLVIQSWTVPRTLRAAWSWGQKKSLGQTIGEFFAENSGDPWRLALAVGLGLFFGIAPIWGYQMIAAAAVAHWLGLNKAITLVASNISIPPFMPFILYGALALGHWLLTGRALELSAEQITRTKALEYVGQWLVGSVVLGLAVALLGTLVTYAVARFVRRR